MAFEIIRRKEGEVNQRQEIRHDNTQISINDWGHLVVREFNFNSIKTTCKQDERSDRNPEFVCPQAYCDTCNQLEKETIYGEEHLVVFDKRTTERILRFVEKIIGRELPF